MSLEQAILDRLEQRNGQIAQLRSTVDALEHAADVQRKHARKEQERLRDARQRLDDLKLELREEAGKRWNATEERDALVQENTKLGARIERMEESAASAELLRKSLNDEITKRDHELRAHEKELAEQREEIRAIIETATYFGMTSDEGVGNFIKRKCIESEDVRDEIIRAETNLELVRRECEQIRREVPLESTREGLKNATAKLQEVNAQLDSAKGEAEEWLKQCHAARRQRDEVKAEARKETQRLSDLCAELQSKYESLLAAQNTVKADVAMVYQIADKLGRNQAESIPEFMERQALRLAAHETKAGPSIETLSAELSVRYAEIAELHKWALVLIENPSFAKNAPEHTRNYRDIVERINSRPQLDLTATLPVVDWQVVARNLEQTIAGLNAKVAELEAQAGKIGYVAKSEHEEAVTAARENGIHKGESLSGFIWRQCEGLRKSQAENAPLTKLFVVLCKQRGNLNEEIIYRAVDEASEAIKQLTA